MLDLCPGKEREAGLGDAGDTGDTASVGQGRTAAGTAQQLRKEHRWCEPQPCTEQRLFIASIKHYVRPFEDRWHRSNLARRGPTGND